MPDAMVRLLEKLTDAPGVPGFEDEVRSVVEAELQGYATLERDRLGSVIATKKGSQEAPRVMIAGHLDEVGFMVTRITDEGFLKFQTLGGWWEQVMLAQRVRVHASKGAYTGVIGSKPPHVLPAEERKKPVKMQDMFIDIGAKDADEAREMGVRPGDPVTPICPFETLGNGDFLLAKAWDDRAGCAILVEVMRALKAAGSSHPNTVYGVATVQEEVGLRGAATSAYTVEPDVGFALDVTIAGDTPGMKREEANTKLGQGPAIVLYDASLVPHLRLRDLVIETAESEGIPYQFDVVSGGGTDAGRIQLYGSGVPSVAICVPTRYIHSHAGILHRRDLEETVRLLVALINRLDGATVASLQR